MGLLQKVKRAQLAQITTDKRTVKALEAALNGTMPLSGLETGTGTPALGANKPGVSGPPTTWAVVTIDGEEWMFPLWKRST